MDQTDIMTGQDATFSVTVVGDDTVTYQWQKDGLNITDTTDTYSGTATPTLTVQSVTEGDAGSYTCVVTGSVRSITSNPAQLTVLPPVVSSSTAVTVPSSTADTVQTSTADTVPSSTTMMVTSSTTEAVASSTTEAVASSTTEAVASSTTEVVASSTTEAVASSTTENVASSTTAVLVVSTSTAEPSVTPTPSVTPSVTASVTPSVTPSATPSTTEPPTPPGACPLLTTPSNGGISYSNESRGEGTVATYSCNSGYILVGEMSRTCDSTNAWSGSNVTCVDPKTIAAEVVLPADPLTGQSYSLTCTVTGADSLNPTITGTDSLNPTISYQWTRGSTTVGTNSAILTFGLLMLSNNGQYRCEVTLSSSLLSNPLTVNSPTVDLIIQILPPTVTVTPPTDMVFVGDSFTLTCIAQLDSSVDVAVSVTVVWMGLGTFSTSEISAELGSQSTSHNSTLTVSVAMATDSGEYSCSVVLDSASNFITTSNSVSGKETVTVVPAPSAPVVTANPQTTSIMFSWSQEESDVVESYTISLVYMGTCSVTVEEISGSQGGGARQFNGTELIGFSEYQFTLTAINRAGSSPAVSTASTSPSAPSGHVQNLVVSSHNSSSISLQWDRVNCVQRNGEITGYNVTFGPTTETVIETDSRVYTATGLIPRSEYTFQVSPFSSSGTGPSESVSQTTLISPDITLYLGGQLFSNNSLVDPMELGEDDQALLCLTNYQSCCDSVNGLFGEWYSPNMEIVNVKSFSETPLYRNRGPSLVRLHRRGAVGPSEYGIYRCAIRSGAGASEDVYVGLYPPGQGSPTINTDIVFARVDLSLTCTSNGGPASEVVWTRNGVLVGQNYSQTQVVTNLMQATYSNILRASNISHLVGEFVCTVTNARGSDSRTIVMDGITIEANPPFTVGSAASIRCVSESPATMIQWLDPNRIVVATTTTEQSLDVEFNPVSDSLHNSVYTCSVTRTAAVREENVSLTVSVPDNSVSVVTTVPVAPVAGTMYTVSCVAMATISGLMAMPTAVWEFDNGAVIGSEGDIMVTTPTSNMAELRFTSIRTSQAGGYVCRGTQTSPALSSPQTVTDTANVVVMVPAPMVSLTDPPSPLYAGTSLSLTCTVSVLPAVDTAVTYAITWERIREDGPVAIETGTSTVSTITVSTLDSGYTCRAAASTTQSTSPEGSNSSVVMVTDPPPPVVSAEFSRSPIAGTPYTLLCRATAPILLVSPPTVSVIGVDSSVAVTPTSTVSGSESIRSVMFSPLLTSRGGVYTCQAGYNIPQADLPDLSNSTPATVVVQIPRPTAVSISPRPDVEMFTIGLNLDLVCRVELISAVDSPLGLSSVWTRDGTPVVTDSLVNVRDFQMVGNDPQVFESVVEFRPLTDVGNDTDYTCNITIVAQDTSYISGTSATVSTSLTVEDFPFQVVQLPPEVTVSAGSPYTLSCVVSRSPGLMNSTLEVEWFRQDGSRVRNGENGITISGPSSSAGSMLTSGLEFSNVMTSLGGQYTCSVNLTIAGTEVIDHNVNRTTSLRVQTPSPLVTITPGRIQPHYEGTTLELTCTITVSLTGVDTAVLLDRVFTGTTSDVSATMERTVTVSQTFDPLGLSNGGLFTCSATVDSSSDVPNSQFIVSQPAQDTYTLTVSVLPVPMVTISPSSLTIPSGQSTSLTCAVTVRDYLVTNPTVEWRDGDGQEVGVDSEITMETVTTSTVMFPALQTSQAGPYTCTASIDVPSVNIVNRSNSNESVVTAQILTPLVSIMTTQPAYHGTTHNLTCTIVLDSSVNTPITLDVVWRYEGNQLQSSGAFNISQTTQSGLEYSSILSISPLNQPDMSSGDYLCEVRVQPNIDTYISEASGSGSETLEVLAAPAPVVTTDVPGRPLACREASVFTCSGFVLDSFVTRPDIIWRGPDSQVVGNKGNLDIQNGGSRIPVGTYTCMACVTVSSVSITDLCNSTSVTIDYSEPGPVESLSCPVDLSAADTLKVSWTSPTVSEAVVGYQVEVRQYVSSGGRQVSVVELDVAFNREIPSIGTSVPGLAPAVRYQVSVMAVSAGGCGSVNTVECYTMEGEPSQVKGVKVVRLSDSQMNVSWTPLTIVETKGFLKAYLVTYSSGGVARRKRQAVGPETVAMNESGVVIGGLDPAVDYDVTVSAQTTSGIMSPASSVIKSGTPPGDNTGVVIGVILMLIIIFTVAVAVASVVIVFSYRRYSQKGKFNISTQRAFELSPVRSLTAESASPSRSAQDGFDQLENEKSREATTEITAVATSAEVLDRMKPISLTSFRNHVQMMHDDRAKGFEAEYQSFSLDPLELHEIAKIPHNRIKNRFANIFPFDHSRVTLKEVPGVEGSDYINACFMHGYKRDNCYVAAQGPMPNSVDDFWRLIWEHKLDNIVMLTRCKEGGRVKCEQYWAEEIGSVYETETKNMNITTTSVVPFADFVIRQFTLKNTKENVEPLKVNQFHFTAWPDHGVPKFATSLISFIRKVQRGHNKDKGIPLLVHCSAGVGRTGTFITLDSMLERIHKETSVNVYEFVKIMRTRRVLMVQTMAQYTFIHDALDELITCGETDIPASVLRTKFKILSKVIPGRGITGFTNQFQLLEQASRVSEPEDVTDATEHYNLNKNRYPDIVPYNMSRARLRPTGEDGSEYINASFVDGYKQRNAYIATQGPLKNTVDDVWRMLWEFKSKTLVMVCRLLENGEESAFPYWPVTEGEAVQNGKINVTLQSSTDFDDFTVRKFMIQEERPPPAKPVEGFVVTQFHYTEWPTDGRPNTGTLIEMLDMITKSQMSTGNRPITVICSDGVGRTGTFICIHAQLERLKTEGVVDFFQSIKSSRIQRAGLIPHVVQYSLCHEVLADYIDKFDNYANFKDMI